MNTTFRRLAPHLWRDAKDPSTYGEVDLDLSEVDQLQKTHSVHFLAVLFKALSEGYKAVPQVNSEVRLWKITARKEFAISLMVPHKIDDLCFATLRHLDSKNILQIDSELKKQLADVRSQNGVAEYHSLFAVLNFIPRFLLPLLSALLRFFISRDLFKIPLVPRRPFGSIIVSNVGSLGFQRAFLPLVAFTRASVMVSVGRLEKRALVVDDSVSVRHCVTIGFNLDHRIMDGFHAQKFIAAFKDVFKSPQKYS